MLLQSLEGVPSPQSIKDTVTALIWVVGFLLVVIGGLIYFANKVLNKQEKQYEDRLAYLVAQLEEKEKEVKDINSKVIDNIVPTIKSLDTTLGKFIEQNRK